MGAEGAFDRRRIELAEISGRAAAAVTDEEVMFVHGAVSKDNIGAVPGGERYEDVETWAERLNKWAGFEIIAFKQRPYRGNNTRGRAGHGLMDYCVPKGNAGRTVVYDSNLVGGNAFPMDPTVRDFLKKSGINTIVCGHTPHGDCPTVITTKDMRVITADTSYSKMGHLSPKGWGIDNRGPAVSEVVIWEDGSVDVYGILADEKEIEYSLGPPTLDEAAQMGKRTSWEESEFNRASTVGGGGVTFVAEDGLIGRQLKDQSWIKAKLKKEGKYLVCRGEGFKIFVDYKTDKELHDIGFADSKQAAPACLIKLSVINLKGAPIFASHLDKLDPFIKGVLHDGHGRCCTSEFETTYKRDAGGTAIYNESFILNKPEGLSHLRISLWDQNDFFFNEQIGFGDINLNFLWDNGENNNKMVHEELRLLRIENLESDVEKMMGLVVGTVTMEITMTSQN